MNLFIAAGMHGGIPELLSVMTTCEDPHARHLACILVRQRIVKRWIKLPVPLQQSTKLALLHMVRIRDTIAAVACLLG